MPKDSWRSANDRAQYGPVRRTGSAQRPKKNRTHRVKNKFVSIGVCVVEAVTNRAVLVVTPEGKTKWLPRTVLMNGNMKFKKGQALTLHCAKWCAQREGLAFGPMRPQPAGGARPPETGTPVTANGEAAF